MPNMLESLATQFLEEKRQKEKQKNENTMMKMRMDALTQQAQELESEQKGATDAMREVAPVVAMWQDQAAQAINESREADRRALAAEATMLSTRQVANTMAESGISSMGDVLEAQQNWMRLQYLNNPEAMATMDPLMAASLFGTDFAKQLPAEKLGKEFLTTAKEEQKFARQLGKEREAALRTRMMQSFMRDMDMGLSMEEALENMAKVQAAFEIASPGPAPPPMEPPLPERIERKPSIERERPRPRPGERIGRGKHIVAGEKYPTELTKEEENKALREGYKRIIKETFPMYPDDEINAMIDEVMKEGQLETPMTRAEAQKLLEPGQRLAGPQMPGIKAREKERAAAELRTAQRRRKVGTKGRGKRPAPTATKPLGVEKALKSFIHQTPTEFELRMRKLLFPEQ